jgi:hypothetical protein
MPQFMKSPVGSPDRVPYANVATGGNMKPKMSKLANKLKSKAMEKK